MGKIYNWFARVFNPRVVELERELSYSRERADNLTYTIKRLNDQVYYLSEQVSKNEQQIQELRRNMCENT